VAFFIGHSHDKNGKRLLWCDNKSGAFDKPSFDPNRVAQSTIIHRLDVHAYFCERGRIKLGNHGTKWISENNYPKNISYRPDAIFEVNNMTIALELERTAKTKKRYQKIVTQHLRKINNGSYECIHYVSSVPGFAVRLERLFNSITKLPVRGQQVLFSEELRQHFKLYDFNNWRFLDD
jgi:predicted ester cyclase